MDWRVREPGPAGAEQARGALSAGVGCGNADFLALSQAERQACEARLADDVNNARSYAVVSPKLKKQFDGVFECPEGDVWCEYRIGKGVYPGMFAPQRKKRTEWD
jgi:hypothetical protein